MAVVAELSLHIDLYARALGELHEVECVGIATLDEHMRVDLCRCDPEVVILDAGRQNLYVSAELARYIPAAALVVISSECDRCAFAFAEFGVLGILGSDATIDDLVAAVRAVSRKEAWCTRRAGAAIVREVAELRTPGGTRPAGVTRREAQVLDLIAAGLSNREIAAYMNIELCTVKNHVHHLLEKLGVNSRGEAVSSWQLRTQELRARNDQGAVRSKQMASSAVI